MTRLRCSSHFSNLVRRVASLSQFLGNRSHPERNACAGHALVAVVEVDVDGQPAGEEGATTGAAELVRVWISGCTARV